MSKNARSIALVAAGAAIALVVGGGFGAWLSQRSPLPAAVDLPAGAAFVPRDAMLLLSVSSNLDQWQTVRQFGTPQSRGQLDELLATWRDRLLTANGFDYSRDLQPWVGQEATLALFSPVEAAPVSPGNAPSLPAALLLPVEKPAVANTLLQQPRLATGQTLSSRTYKGVQIQEVRQQGQLRYAATLLNQTLLVTNQPQLLEKLIDTAQGDAAGALPAIAGFREAFAATASPSPLLRLYLNGPSIKSLAAANSLQPAPLLGLTPIQTNQGLVATMAVEPQGLRLRGVNWLPPDSKQRYAANNNAGDLVQKLPANTQLLISGSGLKEAWERYQQQGGVVNPRNPLNPSTLREGLLSTTGLNLEQSLVSWMDGEFALALVPESGPEANRRLGVVMLVETSDRAAATQTLTALDEVMNSRYQFQVSKTQRAGQPATTWTSPYGALSVTHGWLDNKTAFLAVGSSFPAAPLTAETTLMASESFQATASKDLTAHNGQVFVDLSPLLATETLLPLPTLPNNSGSLLAAIQSLGLKTAIRSDRSTQYDLRLQLQKASTPAPPLPPPRPVDAPAAEPSSPAPALSPTPGG